MKARNKEDFPTPFFPNIATRCPLDIFRYLLNRMPWRILELYPEGIQEYNNYQDYLQTRQALAGPLPYRQMPIKLRIQD